MHIHHCPTCNKELHYSNRSHFLRAVKRNCKCQRCSKLGRTCTTGLYGEKNPSSRPEVREKLRQIMLGRVVTWGNKISKTRISKGIPSARKGVTISIETRRRCRESAIKRIKRLGDGKIVVGFNPRACEYFDWLNKFMGWNGLHALNGGEKEIRGFFVDYYEPKLNLVIEWDEPSHYVYGVLRKKDIQRQREIINELKCEFYRYRQQTNTLERVS